MKNALTFAAALSLAASSFGGEVLEFMLTDHVAFSGRWLHKQDGSCVSAPAASLQFNAVARSVSFDLEGDARWRFDMDGKPVTYFKTSGRTTKKLGAAGDGAVHSYKLIKITESNPGEVCVHAVALDGTGSFKEKPATPARRLEFIGDSFSVGYGNEGSNLNPDDDVFEKTDASKSYAYLLAEGFKADLQVNAVSGRGLVRNYDNIVPEWTLERLYNFVVPGSAATTPDAPLWDLSWYDPQVIVLFIGINDFQGEGPYGDKDAFKAAYARLLDKLRNAHPGVKFLLVSTKVWPNDDLTPVVQSIFEDQQALGHKDLDFKVVQTENVGLHGHPDVRAHKEMANILRPIIARLGGWLAR